MASKHALDKLAERISLATTRCSSLAVTERELEKLWERNPNACRIEKCLSIRNFAVVYGFQVEVDHETMTATFAPHASWKIDQATASRSMFWNSNLDVSRVASAPRLEAARE